MPAKANKLSYMFSKSEILLQVFTYLPLGENQKQKQWKHGLDPGEKGPCNLQIQQRWSKAHIRLLSSAGWMRSSLSTHTPWLKWASLCIAERLGQIYAPWLARGLRGPFWTFGISNILFLHPVREDQNCVEEKWWNHGVLAFFSSCLFVSQTPEAGRDPLLPYPVVTNPVHISTFNSRVRRPALNHIPVTKVGRYPCGALTGEVM